MRSKKALVLLLSASMVFTMNNMTFAKTKTASYVSLQSDTYEVGDGSSDIIKLKSSSLNAQSKNDWEIMLSSSKVKIQSENVKKLAELNEDITLSSGYKALSDSELTTEYPGFSYDEGTTVKSYNISFSPDVPDMKVDVSITENEFDKITACTTDNGYSSLGEDNFGFADGKIELKAVGTGTYLFVCSNTSEEPTEEPTEAPTEAPTEEPTEAPTEEPTEAPTEEPTEAPTEEPKTVSEDDVAIPEDKTKPAVIDASESNTAEVPTDVLEKAKENESTEVKIKDAVLTLPQSVVNQLLDSFNGSDIVISLAKETISAEEAAEKYGIVTDKPMEVINITIENFHESFAEPITVAFVVNEDTMELGTGFMYCTSVEPIEFIGSDDVTDGEFTATLKHFSEFVISEEAEANGKYSGSFSTTGMRLYATYSGNEYYTSNGVEVIFADGTEEKKLATDAAAGFKVTAPYAAAGGYKVVKWIPLEDGELVQEYPAIAPGATAALPTLIDGSEVNVNYYPVVESLSNVSSNTISANGHTVTIEYDKTPAFTGKKLTLADLDLAVTIDGRRIDNSLVKIKTKGKKTVGSDVTITLKTIKGLDKVTNKELKNKEIGVAKIRPIQAVYTGLYSKQWSGSEGKVMVSMKGDTVKKVTVEVNSHKVKTGVGYTAKKVVVNKKSYSYDSATKMITFDGTVLAGKVKVRLASK
ncbi:MAG: PT domain-containing protein [Lachnospiraceae bacterium]|nr:PT domain-containing protein [Lachnospiraceae bacterium]